MIPAAEPVMAQRSRRTLVVSVLAVAGLLGAWELWRILEERGREGEVRSVLAALHRGMMADEAIRVLDRARVEHSARLDPAAERGAPGGEIVATVRPRAARGIVRRDVQIVIRLDKNGRVGEIAPRDVLTGP